jgi:hypothetical protein
MPLVLRIGVGVQETDCGRLDPVYPQLLGDPAQARLVERRHLMPEMIETAAHGVAIRPRDERLRPLAADVVKARPVLPADQQQIAKPLIGDEGDAAAAALDDGIGRGRHAVPDIGDIGARPALQCKRPLQSAHRAEGAVLRRRRHLGDGDPPRRLVIGEVVGEGAADIGRDAQAGRGHGRLYSPSGPERARPPWPRRYRDARLRRGGGPARRRCRTGCG